MIPNIAHFVHFQDGEQARPLAYINKLCILAAIANGQFSQVYLHTDGGVDFKHPKLTIVHKEAPLEIYGNPIKYIQHRSDVARLQILQEYGGFYLDTDMYLLCNLKPYTGFRNSIAMETLKRPGCAFIGAERESAFIRAWLEGYKDFNGSEYVGHAAYKKLDRAGKQAQNKLWVGHSIHKMMPLALAHNVGVLNKHAFYNPSCFYLDYKKFLHEEGFYPDSLGHHLWLSVRKDLLKLKGPEDIDGRPGYFFGQLQKLLSHRTTSTP